MFHGQWCFFWTEFHGHLERICFCRFGVELYKCLLLSVDWWYFCLIFFCILADILPSCSINCWEKAMDFLVFLLGMHSSSLKTKIFSEFIRSDQIRSVAQSHSSTSGLTWLIIVRLQVSAQQPLPPGSPPNYPVQPDRRCFSPSEGLSS